MHGDYTRSPYRPHKRFSSVRMQQGRVWLDGDWNEQIELDDHRRTVLVGDVIGCCGAPADNAGWVIDLAPGARDLLISPGRAYAGGILCELPAEPAVDVTGVSATVVRLGEPVLAGRALQAGHWVEVRADDTTTIAQVAEVAETDPESPGPVTVTVDRPVGLDADAPGQLRRVPSYLTQADLPSSAITDLEPGTSYIVFLEVQERHVTALEDPELRESALGGPDTTTRTRTVGQVKVLPIEAGVAPPSCEGIGRCWSPLSDGPVGRLAARAEPDPLAEGPCVIPEDAGFRGLGNQSYLVQVRDASDAEDGPTFVFSRDNGSITHAVASIGPDGSVALAAPPLDRYRTLATNDRVELVDDETALAGRNGPLVRVVTVDDAGTAVTTDPQLPELGAAAAARGHAYLRRWDHTTDPLPLTTGEWLTLELGVQVRFEEGGFYRVADHWRIPARTAIGDTGGDVLWPVDGQTPRFEAPHGPRRGFCALAVLTAADDSWTVEGCLPLFVPVADTVAFDVVGGDGQQAGPGSVLDAPLEVRVSRGGLPHPGAAVRFSVIAGGGAVLVPQPTATGLEGVASVRWRLGAAGPQRVEARLLGGNGQDIPGAVARFSATVFVPDGTGDGCDHTVGERGEFRTIEEAIRTLGERGERQVCLCLGEGVHPVELEFLDGASTRIRSLNISGCGPLSRLTLRTPITIRGLARLTFTDLAIVLDNIAEQRGAGMWAEQCREVHITRCWIAAPVRPPEPQEVPSGAALRIGPADDVRIRDCTLEAVVPRFDQRRILAVQAFDGTPLEGVFRTQVTSPVDFTGPVFAETVLEVAVLLAADDALRERMALQVAAVTGPNAVARLTPLERTAYGRFAVRAPTLTDPEALLQLIESIRRASVLADGGVALEIEQTMEADTQGRPRQLVDADGDENVVIEGCDVRGTISLSGPTTSDQLVDEGVRAKLRELARANIIDSSCGTVRLQGNLLGRITVGLALWQQLAQVNILDRLGATPNRCLLVDNTIASAGHIVVAGALPVSGNVFSLGAELPGQFSDPIGFGMAGSASYVGNHARLRVTWDSGARIDARTANVELQIAP